MASYNPKSSYFCEYRLHAKFQLARLCRSCVFEKVPLSLSDRQTPDTHKSKCSSSLGLSWESNEARLGWQVGARARLTDRENNAVISCPLTSLQLDNLNCDRLHGPHSCNFYDVLIIQISCSCKVHLIHRLLVL